MAHGRFQGLGHDSSLKITHKGPYCCKKNPPPTIKIQGTAMWHMQLRKHGLICPVPQPYILWNVRPAGCMNIHDNWRCINQYSMKNSAHSSINKLLDITLLNINLRLHILLWCHALTLEELLPN